MSIKFKQHQKKMDANKIMLVIIVTNTILLIEQHLSPLTSISTVSLSETLVVPL